MPASLVPQWQDELSAKFGLDFAVADASKDASFWIEQERVLASIHLAKSSKNFEAVTAAPWDLIVVDEAHHCKNRKTRNWQLVNALRRRHLFLLTATPVQNDLLELYNLLTLLEPGHLRTEADFKDLHPPGQPARPAQPGAAARTPGPGHDPQHPQPRAYRPAAALRPNLRGPTSGGGSTGVSIT